MFSLNSSHRLLALILVLAAILRFVALGHPNTYIFDEVYHAFTARQYLVGNIDAWEWWTTPPEGVAYEWTHPPVAKYGMMLGLTLFGDNAFGYRSTSALLGVLSILGLYTLTLRLTGEKKVALLAAFLLTIEGTHLAQSRIAMNDIYLLNFYIWALVAALSRRYKLAAILYGLALGSKWSAVYGLIPLAFIYLRQLSPTRFTLLRTLLSAIRLAVISLAVYVLTFTPFITSGHSWAQWWELHRQMWYYHTHLVATHAYQSTPLQWIFAARPVWYWVEYETNAISNIYVQGNPLILWFGLFALILQLPKALSSFSYSILYTLYLILFIPWVFSPRIMFYYHYLPSSVFLLPLLSLYLTHLPKKIFSTLLLLFVLSFVLMTPMLYGFATPKTYWDTLFTLFPTWR